MLDAARTWFDEARACDATHGPLRDALMCLRAAPATPAVAEQLRLVETVSKLGRYDLPSRMHAREPLPPREVRDMPDKLEVFARLLAVCPGAYRGPEVLELGRELAQLGGVPAARDDAVLRVRLISMLADAAVAAQDLPAASTHCERLARVAPSLPDTAEARAARDGAWRACFQLAKHPEWRDGRQRAKVLAHALALAPPEHLSRLVALTQELDASALAPSAPQDEVAAAPLARLLSAPWARGPQPPRATPGQPPRPARAARTAQPPPSRAAALLDDVADPADRAARVARSLGSSLSRGMGWLMGEEPARG